MGSDITGVFEHTRWRSKDEGSDFQIGYLEDGTCVLGDAPEGEFLRGVEYRFFGKWAEHNEYGKQFKFTHYVRREPLSRHGVVAYLKKYAPNVGASIAGRLWDMYGERSVIMLRIDPEEVSDEIRGLSIEGAREASLVLTRMSALEDTKIELTNLLDGRGFPGALIEAVIAKWSILAPERIRSNPLGLMVEGFTGCGFLRCDRLYLDLGHDPAKMKRQVLCMWHLIRSDMSGSTWLDGEECKRKLGEFVSEGKVEPDRAIECGVRAQWLDTYRNGDGKLWIAEGRRAADERRLAAKLIQLGALG